MQLLQWIRSAKSSTDIISDAVIRVLESSPPAIRCLLVSITGIIKEKTYNFLVSEHAGGDKHCSDASRYRARYSGAADIQGDG